MRTSSTFVALGLLALAAALAPACAGGGDEDPADAGPRDAGPHDAGPHDAGPHDAGPHDAGPPDEDWSACPGADAHVADPAWTTTFVEPDDVVLCTVTGENNDARPIAEVFRTKLMLRLPAGTYRLPDDDGTYAYTLPLCTKGGASDAPQGIAGAGTVTRAAWIAALQPLAIGEARMTLYDPAGARTFEVCVDGDGCDFDQGLGVRFLGADCAPPASAWDTPRPEVFRRERLTVTFEGGALTFDVVTIVGSDNPDIIGLYPVAGPLLSVQGNYGDVVIDTDDYWEMAYWAGHHVIGQYFGVLLPAPGGETCALEVSEQSTGDTASYVVHRLGCDFERLGELAFESFTREPL